MNRETVLGRLRGSRPVIAPSMLKCDFGDLAHEIELLEAAGAKVLHWDVMDGHFVPNLSYGALLIESLRGRTDLIFDAHLMISEPARYLDAYLQAGCNCLTVHAEAVAEPASLLQQIRDRGAVAGLAINPKTPVESLTAALPACDVVLVMSVEPGFGGQAFMPQSLEKLRQLRSICRPDTLLAIDGGIGPTTIARTAEAGADLFVVGSAIFDETDYRGAIEQLESLAAR